MGKLPDLFVNAIATWNGAALGKGEKQISGFDKGVKKLSRTLVGTFGAAAMLAYGRNAVKAFAENEKSAKRLETVLENIGLGFETAAIERNLGDISAKFGLEGELLREAFQGLITVTGSATKAQDLLNLSLDVAAGSGTDLLTVNRDLAAVYVGNTKGLRKYNLGLAQSELKTLGFNDAVELLTRNFAGAATAELETYAGKMRVLREAADNAQETIGGALIEAFMKLAGDTTVEDLNDSVNNLADSLAAVIELTGQIATPFVGLAKFFNKASENYVKLLYKATGTTFMGKVTDREYGGVYADKFRALQEKSSAAARAKAEAAAAKRQKELLALQKKAQIAEKNKLSLSKAAAVFDTTRISIAAALQATYDKETRLRLEALMAIEEENGNLAIEKINQLAAFQANADFARLSGVKQISDATLLSINTQLLTELAAINKSKMAEADKELAREEAFKKYNAAITAAGLLSDKASYSERVQIQLTEIARLASLSNTSNAQLTLIKFAEAAELASIQATLAAELKAIADSKASETDKAMARDAALKRYADALKSINSDEINSLGPINAAYTAAYNLRLQQEQYLTAVRLAGIRSIQSAENDSLTDKLRGFSTSALALSLLASAEREIAIQRLASDIGTASLIQGIQAGLTPAQASAGAAYAAQGAYNYYISITAGIGDPEAIARQIETLMNQSQDRGASINRGSGLYIE